MPHMKSLLLKTLGIMLALSEMLAFSMAVLAADPYPSKPVRLIVPDVAGGGQDVVARLIAPKLSERLGKQVVVENRGGAGGIIATEVAAKSDPDGYTLILAAAKHTIQPVLQKLPYDPIKSFTPIARLGGGPYVLVVHPSVPANSLKEFIALVKQKPGQLIIGSSGLGSTGHMSAELFRVMADIDFKLLQFKGGGPAPIDLLGCHSHAYFGVIPTSMPHIKSGKLRALGTGGVKRSVVLTDVPTIAEAGLPGYKVTGWIGILAPTGTPAAIVDRLNKELRTILTLDEMKKVLQEDGLAATYLGPAQFGAMLEREIAQWASVIKRANIKIEK